MSFISDALKPNKFNVVGTVALLVVVWVSTWVSRLFEVVSRPRAAGFGNFSSNFSRFNSNSFPAGQTFYNYRLVPGLLNYILLAVLFYLVVSLILQYDGVKR